MSTPAQVAGRQEFRGADSTAVWTTRTRTTRLWRQWRSRLIIGLIVVMGAAGIALLHRPPANQYLNPGSVAGDGTHALADILTDLGHQVTAVTTVPAALHSATAGSTLVITSPEYLSDSELTALASAPANVLLVDPTAAALARVAAPVTLFGSVEPVVATAPECQLRAAVLAGTADMGGENLLVLATGTGQQCYTSTSGPTLVQLQLRGRAVTVLGTAAPLTNAALARQGNAALAVNLMPSRRIVWLVPPVAAVAAIKATGPKTFFGLLPLSVYLVAIQLAFAVLLAVGWRARRLGQLVAEPLPVVVRASETTEGHGRLYQARHARGKAAAALRRAALSRLGRAAGLPPGASPDAVSAALAQRSGSDQAVITDLLYGPTPRSDQTLVTLARDLDELEREVGKT
jgi:Domain of unknown function (DUF4350)